MTRLLNASCRMVIDAKVVHKSVRKVAKVVHKSVKYLYISFIFSVFAAKLSKQYKSNEIIDNVPLYALYCYLQEYQTI